MSYLSLKFALFLAAFLIVYYLVPKTGMKQGVILVGNLVFCWGAGASALAIVLGTTFVSYGAAILIERKYADYERVKADLPLKARVETFNGYKKRCRGYLYAAMTVSIVIFTYVKIGRYLGWRDTGFANFAFGRSVIVPIGISYYTFMLVGYVLDVYWGKAKAQHSYLKFLMFLGRSGDDLLNQSGSVRLQSLFLLVVIGPRHQEVDQCMGEQDDNQHQAQSIEKCFRENL